MPVSAVNRQSNLPRSGNQGDAVSELQRLLNDVGYTLDVDGDFGPLTRAAVRSFQRDYDLLIDGIPGPRTMAALNEAVCARVASSPSSLERSGTHPQRQQTMKTEDTFSGPRPMPMSLPNEHTSPGSRLRLVRPTDNSLGETEVEEVERNDPRSMESFRERILTIAENEIGTLERTGRNDGAVEKYSRAFGRGREAYCADFTSWVLNQAGGELNSAYCPTVRNLLIERGLWKGRQNPEPGDLVLFDWDQDRRADHIGILKSVNSDGSLNVIEGNTEYRGRQGVFERVREMRHVLGFGKPF